MANKLTSISLLRSARVGFLVLSILFSQTLSFAATPIAETTPDPGTPVPEPDPIVLALRPVGDHKSGYFNDLSLQPGSSIALEVEAVNSSEIAVEVNAYVTNAANGLNGGFMAGFPEDELAAPALWVELEPVTIVLEPMSSIMIPFTITVPPDAKPGQYIAALVIEESRNRAVAGTDQYTQNLRYAISLGILVPGDLTFRFAIEEPIVDDRSVMVPVANSGTYLVRPQGTITVTNSVGEVVISGQVQMGSIYAGNTAPLLVGIPQQLPAGQYSLTLALKDTESGTGSEIEDVDITISETSEPTALILSSAEITPNGDPISYVGVDILVTNTGGQLPTTDVNLIVSREGEVIDEFALAQNQVLLIGDNSYSTRYIPLDSWLPGEYTFEVQILAVNTNEGPETIILEQNLETVLIVP